MSACFSSTSAAFSRRKPATLLAPGVASLASASVPADGKWLRDSATHSRLPARISAAPGSDRVHVIAPKIESMLVPSHMGQLHKEARPEVQQPRTKPQAQQQAALVHAAQRTPGCREDTRVADTVASGPCRVSVQSRELPGRASDHRQCCRSRERGRARPGPLTLRARGFVV